MNTSDTAANGADNDAYISFSNNDSSTTTSSNWRKTPFKPPHQNLHEQFSPHGSPQGFSSPIYHQRNFGGNRSQSGNSYGDRFRGNQSYSRGKNWRNNRNDNRRPYNNQSFNKSGSGTVDISDYFHPSMIQDPWKHFQRGSCETNPTFTNADCEDENRPDSSQEAKDENEPGDNSANSTST